MLMMRRSPANLVGVPAWWRRVAAFLVDFYFALATILPITVLVALALEARRTGHFAWMFDRPYSVPSDVWLIIAVPLDLTFTFLYFALPLTRGRQTVGCFLLQTKVLPRSDSERRLTWNQAIWRTYDELRGLFRWWLLIKPKRDTEGNTWYDTESDCRVVSVDYKSVR
jgi:uncharacterized RDD family membrane protein YckC